MGLVVRMVLCAALLTACTAQQPQGTGQGDGGISGGDGGTGSWWQPRPGTSWQWQLSGALDVTVDAGVYDIDLFDNAPAQIAALQGMGRKVVCYFDTAYEPGRPDSSQLDPYKGNPVSGWPGQYWLDIRQPAVVNVMKARVALAQQKGCDAVEADDVDSRTNNPGFPITAADQQGFIRSLAAEAHSRRISFALKNDLDEIPQLLADVDFALNEECFQYNECSSLQPFIAANKAVFQVEYTSGDLAAKGATICPQANALNFDTLIKHVELDAPRYSCR
ncbi:MAG: endo alpha-1,4 polygalactosaminidase [Deltaproteobacteria bacterium]|nr:MAG: endo alpha-1,4 polygalactosaminidase [Deltaproteobacteria bacterium]